MLHTSANDDLLVDGDALQPVVVDELDADGPLVPVEQYPRGGGVEHDVKITPVSSGPEEGPGRREPRAVARGRLGDREARVCTPVQVHRLVVCARTMIIHL